MALVGISNFEDEEYISVLDPCRILYPEKGEDGKPHPKAGQADIASSEEKGATIFVTGALTVDQRAWITDKTGVVQESDGEGGFRMVHRTGTRNLQAVRFGIRGWRNFKDPSNADIPIKRRKQIIVGNEYEVLDDDTIGRMGLALVTEIGEYILNRNSFVESLAKNLSGLAPQSPSSQNSTAEAASPVKKSNEDATAPSP